MAVAVARPACASGPSRRCKPTTAAAWRGRQTPTACRRPRRLRSPCPRQQPLRTRQRSQRGRRRSRRRRECRSGRPSSPARRRCLWRILCRRRPLGQNSRRPAERMSHLMEPLRLTRSRLQPATVQTPLLGRKRPPGLRKKWPRCRREKKAPVSLTQPRGRGRPAGQTPRRQLPAPELQLRSRPRWRRQRAVAAVGRAHGGQGVGRLG
jgi:hypothetical protein